MFGFCFRSSELEGCAVAVPKGSLIVVALSLAAGLVGAAVILSNKDSVKSLPGV